MKKYFSSIYFSSHDIMLESRERFFGMVKHEMAYTMCSKYGLFSNTTYRSFVTSELRNAVYEMKLDQTVEDKLKNAVYKHRNHDGIRKSGRVYTLSERLEAAAISVLSTYPSKQLKTDGETFFRKFWSRLLPLENREERFFNEAQSKVIASKMGISFDNLSEVSEKIKTKHKNRVQNTVGWRKSLWKSFDYDAFNSFLYLYTYMAPNYTILTFIFKELIKSDPQFRPKSVFSFGSGVGTDVWASHSMWADSVKEYYCVDISQQMNDIAELISKDGILSNESFVKNLFFRQFLPATHDRKFDLVVSSFSLLELPSSEERLKALENLWQKTENYLLIVENGTNSGYSAVQEARDFILHSSESLGHTQQGYVVAPCPHDVQCPRVNDGTKSPCNFQIRYQKLNFGVKHVNDKFLFSYVLLKKGQRPSIYSWPRIVRPVKSRHKHTLCELCCPDGQLKEATITKGRHGYDLYKCSTYLKWGDLLPISFIRQKSNESENSEVNECKDL